MKRLLIVEDKESLALMLKETVELEGLEADIAANGSEAIRRLAEGRRYFAVLTDLRLPGSDGIAVLKQVKESDPDCPVIVMTAFGTIENAVEAMKLGAHDFIQKPIDVDYLLLLLRESGTGKELFARAIHQLSPRRDRPFVAINCAAIPDTLIENELFGHEKGAFTGASSRQLGKFELADTGTIFLDEIGELGHSVQSKLLRVIQERRFERIGGGPTIEADVRIICATNRNLIDDVKQGRFREDLFFRVNVFPITVPPLRARREDIDSLTDFFVQRFARELAKPQLRVTPQAREALRSYDWPGNIRELENCIERAAILCDRSAITPADLHISASASPSSLGDAIDLTGTMSDAIDRATRAVEHIKITEALRRFPSRADAAESLGIS